MKRKTWMALAVLTLMAGMFTGCGSVPEESSGESRTIETEEPEGNGGDETVTLRIVSKELNPQDETQMAWLEEYNRALAEAGINAQLELVNIQSGSYADNLALMLNGGDIPDLIYFQGGDQTFANQGILEDLTPYIEKSIYMKDVLEDFQKERLSNYPYLVYVKAASIKVPVIRGDVLDSLQTAGALLENPTVDNYTAMLKELKQDHEAVFGMDGSLDGMNSVFDQAFGLTQTWIKNEAGEYEYARVSQRSLEQLKYYADLYQQGIIDQDYLNVNWERKENDFYGNTTAIICGSQGETTDIYNSNMVAANGESAALRVLPPAKGEAQGYTPLDTSKETRGFAISAQSEHKDLAFQVLDFACSPEGRVLDLLGLKGKTYTEENGKYTLLPAHDNWFAVIFGTFANFDMDTVSEETPYWSEAAVSSKEMSSAYSTLDNAFVIPEEYTISWDAANSTLSEFIADFVLGNKTEQDWDAFVEEWNRVGGAAVTEYANSVLK